jgi:hypothetical protein
MLCQTMRQTSHDNRGSTYFSLLFTSTLLSHLTHIDLFSFMYCMNVVMNEISFFFMSNSGLEKECEESDCTYNN